MIQRHADGVKLFGLLDYQILIEYEGNVDAELVPAVEHAYFRLNLALHEPKPEYIPEDWWLKKQSEWLNKNEFSGKIVVQDQVVKEGYG